MKYGITTAADDKTGLTLGELAHFVQSAYRSDISREARVHVTTTTRGYIKRIEVEWAYVEGTEVVLQSDNENQQDGPKDRLP